MLTIVIPAYNNPDLTRACVFAALASVDELKLPCQFILIDDSGNTGEPIVPVYREALGQTTFRFIDTSRIRILRTRETLQYTRTFSLGLALSTSALTFFLSNDMLLTASYLRAVLGVAALSDDFGIIRGRSQHTDGLPQHIVVPPTVVETYDDIKSFSEMNGRIFGLSYVEDDLMCGDAVVVKRSVIERIGVHDCDLVPYFSDLDYGMRAQLAGFRLICAKGAWLHHEGGGYVKRHAVLAGLSLEGANAWRQERIHASWQRFRKKWDPTLPADPKDWDYREFARLAERNRDRVPLQCPWPPAFAGLIEQVSP